MVRLAVCPGTLPDNDYNSFSAFGFGTWAFDSGMKVFGGIGRSYRVPDARELYFRAAPMKGMPAKLIGNPDLDQTSNTEIDLGLENDWENLYLKAKVFYSWLGDFIFYNDSRMTEKFENMDATLYGFSLNGTWSFTEEVYLDFGLAYQRGKKDDPLSGQSGTDMPKIPPLKGNLALNWEYMPNSLARAELIASDKWSDYDGENGEQELDGWAVLNLNVRHQLTDRIVLIGGIDQASLRSRERFWDIRVPKIDSIFDNSLGAPAVLVTRRSATTSQARCSYTPTGLPYDWTQRSYAPLGSPLAPSARRISRVASQLPGTTRLRFALYGGQRSTSRRLSPGRSMLPPE